MDSWKTRQKLTVFIVDNQYAYICLDAILDIRNAGHGIIKGRHIGND